MELVYLDNAATTPLSQGVKERVFELMNTVFANPSSQHQFGRKAKTVVEECRKYIANSINAIPSEIVFTSGGTEADNMAIQLAVRDLGVKKIITSPLEHHAVLHTIEQMGALHHVEIDFVKLDEFGQVDYQALENQLIRCQVPSLLSIMHVNNEVGNVLDLDKVAKLAHINNVLFHSDTVQSFGSYEIDVKESPIDFLAASAHKFHGPKGVGFIYIRKDHKFHSLLTGGSQERGLRGGTENLWSIGGMHKALEEACDEREANYEHQRMLKADMIEKLNSNFEDIIFHGLSADLNNSSPKILSVGFPGAERNKSMFLFSLDLNGIAVSGGSACSSGSLKGSHVIEGIHPGANWPVIRFSFSKFNSINDIDRTIEALKQLLVQA